MSACSVDDFFPALRHCIDAHPILSAAIKHADTESPEFTRPEYLDLKRHLRLFDAVTLETESRAEDEAVKRLLKESHDRFFHTLEATPPWDITVLPFVDGSEAVCKQLLVVFSYSHSHGDGTAGLALHRTFLKGLQRSPPQQSPMGKQDPFYDPPDRPLLPAMESAATLKISWSYLLGPLASTYLPTSLSNLLNLHNSLDLQTPNTWLAQPMSHDPTALRTELEVLTIESASLNRLLILCRKHGARLTGVLHQLILHALREVLPKHDLHHSTPQDIVASTAINLRKLIPGWTDADMILATSVASELFTATALQQDSSSVETTGLHLDGVMDAARNTGELLVKATSSLDDQPVGLLRYLRAIRPWCTSQLNGKRSCSYELSNIMTFDPDTVIASASRPEGEKAWNIGSMYFSQPANVTGPPLSFNIVSRKGGDLVVCLTWQAGVLSVEDESRFAVELLDHIKSQINIMIDQV